MKAMKDYHNLFLRCDVLLLADFLKKKCSLENYGLCPSHYLRALVLNWYAMHNMIKSKPGLIPDTDTYIFLKMEILIFLIKNLNLTTSI